MSSGSISYRTKLTLCAILLSGAGASASLAQTTHFIFDLPGNLIQTTSATAGLAAILSQPINQVVAPNNGAGFSVVVSSSSPVTYQWKRNGSVINGATADSYFVASATGADEGSYTVVVTNSSGSVTSAAATLYLDSNGNGLPDTWEMTYFGNLNQTPAGDFDNDGVSNFDEYHEGTNPASNTSLNPRLTLVATPGGSIAVSPYKPKYSYGENVTLTATPDAGYGFFGWIGGLTGDLTPANLAMNGNKTVSGVFSTNGVFGWGRNDYGETTIPSGLSNVVAIAMGDYCSLALKSDGTIVGWGYNGFGQLNIPAGLNTAVAIAAGERHSLALKSDGTVAAWGQDSNGQVAVPAGLNNVVAIAAGYRHSLALKSDGTVVAWGLNGNGQATVPAGLNTVVGIAGGGFHSLAVKADGSVVAWGRNTEGQTTVPAAAMSNVVAVAAGDYHSLAVKADGSVVAWGYNGNGQTTVPASAMSNVIAVAAGNSHSLALKNDGSMVAWGDNIYGQLALPTGLANVIAIAAGGDHNLALATLEPAVATPVIINSPFAIGTKDAAFNLRVLARNGGASFGATGLPSGLTINGSTGVISGTPTTNGTFSVNLSATNGAGSVQKNLTLTIDLAVPIITSSNSVIGQIGSDFSYQITASNTPTFYDATGLPAGLSVNHGTGLISGRPTAFGIFTVSLSATNTYGTATGTLTLETKMIIGWGSNNNGETTIPSGLSNVVAIAMGDYCSLALKSDGTIVGWGYNGFGQLNIPAGLNTAVAIAAGERHSLALKSDGTVVAWGQDSNGQVAVPAGLNNVVAIAAGYRHSLALKSDGTVVAWGLNGNGQATVPAGLNTVVGIAGGGFHSLAVKADGSVVAWGRNTEGQTTVPPAAMSNVVAVAAGDYHSLAARADGSVVAWGYNGYGQTTVPVSAMVNVIAVAAGDNHSLALKSDGSVIAWGDNSSGQITLPPGLANVIAIAAGGNHSLALAPPPPVPLTSVVSRMTHGSAGTFDVDLPFTGSPGIECRSGGANGAYTLVFTFANTLTRVDSASVTAHNPASGTGTVSGSPVVGPDAGLGLTANQCAVNLTNVSNAQYITVSLTNVVDSVGNSSTSLPAPSMGVLLGDVNGDGGASNLDVSLVKAKVAAGATVDSSNFRDDVNADGGFSNLDVSITKAQVAAGAQLP